MIHIMFNLIMMSGGHFFWLGSFETLEECQAVQHRLEEMPEHKGDSFACPWIKMEDS